ncbi:hypothetical protein HHI36_010574 [Cryptolaemus montrouzieri]|uniref:Uncharacterized protein n=1 Tax=Cryptolaemus montrouzieri TaxID=559131 RepID=A0ABD2MJK4_9CUCU
MRFILISVLFVIPFCKIFAKNSGLAKRDSLVSTIFEVAPESPEGGPTCLIELLNLYTKEMKGINDQVTDVLNNSSQKIDQTKLDVENYLNSSKENVDQEIQKLGDLEAEAYGQAVAKQKSIADCLYDVRINMALINATELTAYRACSPDIFIFFVNESTKSIHNYPDKLAKNIETCLEVNISICDTQKKCITNESDKMTKKLSSKEDHILSRLTRIENNSKKCIDHKTDEIITMITKLEQNFDTCVSKILGNSWKHKSQVSI